MGARVQNRSHGTRLHRKLSAGGMAVKRTLIVSIAVLIAGVPALGLLGVGPMTGTIPPADRRRRSRRHHPPGDRARPGGARVAHLRETTSVRRNEAPFPRRSVHPGPAACDAVPRSDVP